METAVLIESCLEPQPEGFSAKYDRRLRDALKAENPDWAIQCIVDEMAAAIAGKTKLPASMREDALQNLWVKFVEQGVLKRIDWGDNPAAYLRRMINNYFSNANRDYERRLRREGKMTDDARGDMLFVVEEKARATAPEPVQGWVSAQCVDKIESAIAELEAATDEELIRYLLGIVDGLQQMHLTAMGRYYCVETPWVRYEGIKRVG